MSSAEIVELNRQTLEQHSGKFAESEMLNPGSLQYILEAIQGSLFGHDQFPTVIDKAAALGYRIITRHVFTDGNKRTGMIALHLFLLRNGLRYRKAPPVLFQEMFDVAMQAANSQIDEEGFTKWVRDRVV